MVVRSLFYSLVVIRYYLVFCMEAVSCWLQGSGCTVIPGYTWWECVESVFHLTIVYMVNKFSNHLDITVFLCDLCFESFFGVYFHVCFCFAVVYNHLNQRLIKMITHFE